MTKVVKPGVRATQFLPLLMSVALFFSACARQESDAARETEINRRVQERLVAEHQAEEKQRLAQRETALMAREKALADRESSYGAMSATLATAPPGAAESATETSDDSGAYNDSVANPGVSGVVYPEQYGYPSYDEPDIDDPYFYGSAYPSITYLYTTPRFVFVNRRGFRGVRNGNQRGFGMGGDRGVNMPRPHMIARPPMPVMGHRPPSGGINRPVVGQNHPAPRRTLAYTR